MKRMAVESLNGDEVLAKEITTSGGIVLIPQGTRLRKEYISRLREIDISFVYIEDLDFKILDSISLLASNEEEKIKTQCQKTVTEALEKYSHLGNAELSKIKDVAEEIISDILEEPEVMYSVSGIRNQGDMIYSHCLNVCALSVLLSIKMKLSKEKIRQIAIGSLLHDIGYVYIRGDLVNRPYEELEKEDLTELKKHVIYGFEAIQKEKWLSPIARNIILHHHERLKGDGFPFHLEGDKIKLESRIVAVCDAFDILVYGIYCKPVKVHKAIEEITQGSEKAFDFSVVKVFQESVAAYPNGTKVMTSSGDAAVVVRQNPKCPTRPVLERFCDGEIIDLTKELAVVIRDTI